MKFKIASVLGLIIPFSIALMLTAFLGCGGGSYGGSVAYDGTWSLNLKGYTLPGKDPLAAGDVSCTEQYTNIVITHGYGTTTELITCVNAVSPLWAIDVGVTITPDGLGGIGGIVKVVSTGGGIDTTGTCISRVACQAEDLLMIKCGEAASGC
ncbi:MAG: hypothetical protein KKH12_13380 [Gammaproteobacteria bacterium]|nr:hypothetical protein [Gammaproteobacteria bacterium]MBU1482650.1 hypothetical protein [Gammaproteobacteria bacterium]